MRVGLLTWDYPPAPSGLSTAAREIAESLAGQGCDVTVFTQDRVGEEQVGGVRIIGCKVQESDALGWLRKRGAIGHLAGPWAFRAAVQRIHARAPLNILEATNWYAPAVLLAGSARIALVTRNSTPAAFSQGPAKTLRDTLDNRAANALEKYQARHSAGLISNTADHGNRISALYGVNSTTPHAVIGLSLAPEVLARAEAADYPEAQTPIRILFVGRAEKRKGFDFLMDGAARLASEVEAGENGDFELVLVGVGEDDLSADMPLNLRRRVRALGRQPEDVLAREYASAHIVAAPSRYESFGLVYQEALAYGRPVVACALDASAREFIGATRAGTLAADATGPDFADALRPLLASLDTRMAYRASALKAASRFTRETLGRETLALYDKVLTRKTVA